MEKLNFVSQVVENLGTIVKVFSIISTVAFVCYKVYSHFSKYDIEKILEGSYEKFVRIIINFVFVFFIFCLYIVDAYAITKPNDKGYLYTTEVNKSSLVIKVNKKDIDLSEDILYSISDRELNKEEFKKLSEREKESVKDYKIELPYRSENKIVNLYVNNTIVAIQYPTLEKYYEYAKKEQKVALYLFVSIVTLIFVVVYFRVRSIVVKYYTSYMIFKFDKKEYALLKKIDNDEILSVEYSKIKNKENSIYVDNIYKFNNAVLNDQPLHLEKMEDSMNRRSQAMIANSLVLKRIFLKGKGEEIIIKSRKEIILALVVVAIISTKLIDIFLYVIYCLFEYIKDINFDLNRANNIKLISLNLWWQSLLIIAICVLFIYLVYFIPIHRGIKNMNKSNSKVKEQK